MSARQLIVLVVAAIAAIGALLIIRGMGSRQTAEPAAAAENIAGEQVLVVTRDLPQGAALVPSDLAVRLFPEGSVAPQFVRLSQQPSAQAEYVGAVTRRAFAQGEPITTGSVLQPDGHGFLAAQLEPGFRAVAIEIEPSTSVGGYIQPNDRVDVIMTARVENGDSGSEQMHSDVVLEDIRVLALDDVVQAQTSGEAPTRVTASVAVLELSAGDARTLALADAMGDLSLALRGVEMEMVGQNTRPRQRGLGASGAVRVHAFGSVATGGGR